MTGTAKKFLFEKTFEVDEQGHSIDQEGPAFIYTEDDLTAARAQSQQSGFEAGRAKAIQGIEHRAAETLQVIAGELLELQQSRDDALMGIRAEAGKLALVIAGKLSQQLMQQQPTAEIEQMVRQCLDYLPTTPGIQIIVNDNLVDLLRAYVRDALNMGNFNGEITVLGDPNLAQIDCRVAWAGGGAELDHEHLYRQVEEIVDRYCRQQFDEAAAPVTQATSKTEPADDSQ